MRTTIIMLIFGLTICMLSFIGISRESLPNYDCEHDRIIPEPIELDNHKTVLKRGDFLDSRFTFGRDLELLANSERKVFHISNSGILFGCFYRKSSKNRLIVSTTSLRSELVGFSYLDFSDKEPGHEFGAISEYDEMLVLKLSNRSFVMYLFVISIRDGISSVPTREELGLVGKLERNYELVEPYNLIP